MILCCFTHSLVWCLGGFFVLLVVLPYQTEMIQGYHLLHQLTSFTHELEPVIMLVFLFGLFWVLCFCILFVFGALFLFRFVLW